VTLASKIFGPKLLRQVKRLIVEVDDLGAAMVLAQIAGREEATELLGACAECRHRLEAMKQAYWAEQEPAQEVISG